jgi:5-methyltetrahydrofolate--homocysteine methyltransferase
LVKDEAVVTILTTGRGRVEFGTGHPTLLVNAHLRAYDDDTGGLDYALVERLKQRDFEPLLARARQGMREWDCQVVDICLDAPGLKEADLLPEVALAVHEATGLGLSLDTRNAEALRRTLRQYPHKALINSIDADAVHIERLFPVVAEYKTAVVIILTDEGNIPETVAGRMAVAERLIRAAERHGVAREDLVVDPVAMPSSAVPDGMAVTLETLRALKREFDITTILGVTNSGFGMPVYGGIVQAYMLAAMAAGLDSVLAVTASPIIPLLSPSTLAMDFLTGRDPNGRRYLATYRAHPERFGVAAGPGRARAHRRGPSPTSLSE